MLFRSGIKKISGIYSKDGKGNIFKNLPEKLLLCKGFKLQVPKTVKAGAGGTGAALGNFGEFFKECAEGLKGFAKGFTDYANSK